MSCLFSGQYLGNVANDANCTVAFQSVVLSLNCCIWKLQSQTTLYTLCIYYISLTTSAKGCLQTWKCIRVCGKLI